MHHQPLGVRVIVAYKWVKAAIELGAGIVLLVLLPLGLTEHLHAVVVVLRQHLAHAWSQYAADYVLQHTSRRWLDLTVLVLAIDGAISALEGWSLRYGAWWGPWVVVAASGIPIPIELHRLLERPSVVRLLVIAGNFLIVIYLLRQARRHAREAAWSTRD